jgi:hypothetical protein
MGPYNTDSGNHYINNHGQNPEADVFNCKLKMAMLRLARYFKNFQRNRRFTPPSYRSRESP